MVKEIKGLDSDVGASINTLNIGSSALIIEEFDLRGQKALNTCENSLFGFHLSLGRQKKRGQTWANPGRKAAILMLKRFAIGSSGGFVLEFCYISFRNIYCEIYSKILSYPF